MKLRTLVISSAFIAIALSTSTQAGELVYTPVNPNFGGNPFNADPLLNSANVQNQFSDGDAALPDFSGLESAIVGLEPPQEPATETPDTTAPAVN